MNSVFGIQVYMLLCCWLPFPCPSIEVIYNYGISSYPKGVGVVTVVIGGDSHRGFSRCQSPCILNIGWKYRWLYGDIRCLWTSILKYFSDFESEADKEIKEFVGGLVPCMALKDLEMFCAFFMKLETMSRPKTSSLLSFLLEIIMFRSMPYTLASCMNYAYILWNQILNQSRPSGLQRFILNLVNVQESIGWAKRFSDLIIVVYYCWWFRNPAGHHFRLIVYPNIYQGSINRRRWSKLEVSFITKVRHRMIMSFSSRPHYAASGFCFIAWISFVETSWDFFWSLWYRC